MMRNSLGQGHICKSFALFWSWIFSRKLNVGITLLFLKEAYNLIQRLTQNKPSKQFTSNNEVRLVGSIFYFPQYFRYNTRHVALKFMYLGHNNLGYAGTLNSDHTGEREIFDALTKSQLIESK